MIGSNTRMSILVVLLVVAGSVAVTGAASAQSGNGFDVTVDFPDEFAADDNQTIEVEVTNEDSENDLVSPLIEIQNRSDFDLNSSSVGSVTVDIGGGGSDTRNSYLDDSSFRSSGQALFIEGVSVPAGETNSYEVGLDVDSAGTTDVQIDVRPLNNEDNNDRDTYQSDALGFANIQINSDTSVTLDDESVSANTPLEVLQSVNTDRSYTASADISILDDDLEITGIAPELSNTEPVWFNDTTAGSAADPTVVGHTESTANILSPNTRTVRGNAETPTNVSTSYTLETDGGSTYLVIEDQTTLANWTGTVAFDTDDGTITEIDQTDGVTLVNITATDDVDGSFDFVGYPVGDIDESGDVTESDASTIAQAAADSDLDSINDYGDVNDDGKVTVVDAMLIQQQEEDNRDADYDLTGGN